MPSAGTSHHPAQATAPPTPSLFDRLDRLRHALSDKELSAGIARADTMSPLGTPGAYEDCRRRKQKCIALLKAGKASSRERKELRIWINAYEELIIRYNIKVHEAEQAPGYMYPRDRSKMYPGSKAVSNLHMDNAHLPIKPETADRKTGRGTIAAFRRPLRWLAKGTKRSSGKRDLTYQYTDSQGASTATLVERGHQ